MVISPNTRIDDATVAGVSWVMKLEPVDHLGRPRRGQDDAWWKLMLQIAVGLACGVGSCAVGLMLARSSHDATMVAVPPVALLGLILVIIWLLERGGFRTGYIVVVGSFAMGMVAVLVGYTLALGTT